MTEEKILKLKAERFKKDANLLRAQCTYTILNLRFFELYADKEKVSMSKELVKRFEDLLKDIFEIEGDQ